MQNVFRRKDKDLSHNAPDVRTDFEPAKTILSIAATLGDGAMGIPGLKVAADIAIKIMEVVQVRVQLFT
jgi:hypothetical protein